MVYSFDNNAPSAPELEPPLWSLKGLKRAMLRTFQRVGGFALANASRWRSNRLLVLCYHGISLDDEHLWDSALFISPERFEHRLELLRRNKCHVISLDEGIRQLSDGRLAPASVAITFDDGLYCFYKTALPLLEKFGYPSTLYLTTFYSEFQEPVFNGICGYMLWKCRFAKLDLRPITGESRIFDLSDDCQRGEAFKALLKTARDNKLSATAKAQLTGQVAEAISFDLAGARRSRLMNLMTREEVADASRRGVAIELHTHRHRAPMNRELFLREIEENRQRIQAMTGRTPHHFCYPGGAYDETFLPWLEASEIRSATTCEPGLASHETLPLLVPRLVDGIGLDDVEFEGWLCGLAALLPKRNVYH